MRALFPLAMIETTEKQDGTELNLEKQTSLVVANVVMQIGHSRVKA